MGEERLQTFINFALSYMSQLKLPVKRGTFIEFRTGLINVCPVGRSCSQAEREQFFEFDKEHRIRENFVKSLEEKFPDLGLVYSIGVLQNFKHLLSYNSLQIGHVDVICTKYYYFACYVYRKWTFFAEDKGFG
jgi:hypothetical protein